MKSTNINTFTYQSYDDDFCSFVFGVDEDVVERGEYGYFIRMLRVYNALKHEQYAKPQH